MENLKVKVSSEAESKEAQGYFEDLGAVCCSGLERNKNVNFLFMNSGFLTACKLQENFDKYKCKEITLPQLRDLVVLKRNDVGDATHTDSTTHNRKGYLTCDGVEYFWSYGYFSWKEINIHTFESTGMKPIEKKEMKEYLVKSQDGKWCLETDLVGDPADNVIEVPDGAEAYLINPKVQEFLRNINGGMERYCGGDWRLCLDDNISLIDRNFNNIVWQRETLNDQVASAEEFKQPEYLPFLDNGIDIDVENLPDFTPEFPSEKEIKTDFPLNRGDVNYRAAIAFNAIRGTDLTEDDVHFLRELLNSITNHYGA